MSSCPPVVLFRRPPRLAEGRFEGRKRDASPPLEEGPNLPSAKHDSKFGEGERRWALNRQGDGPLPENRCRFAPAICRPSLKGRAGRLWPGLQPLDPRISHFRVRVLVAAIAGFLATYVPATATNSDKAYNLATRLAATIKKCWIDSRDATFADYVYSPEPNATNGPRILIVPRKAPSAPPVLVIEINTAGEHVSVYGPFATSAQAGRIGADLKRWIGGSDSCG
jgi:hypothetical protein